MPQPDVPYILPPGRTGYEPGMPEPTIPQIVGPGYRGKNRRANNEVEMPMPNPDLLHAGGVGSGYPIQRKNSSSSSSSIEISIEPPSRPPSTIDQPQLESRHHLSPNASPAAELPPQEPVLPIRPRPSHAPSSSGYGNGGWGAGNGNSDPWGGSAGNVPSPYDYDTSGYDTTPSSPVIPGITVAMPQSAPPTHQRSTTPGMPGSIPVPPVPTVPGMENLPPGFVPQTITDKRGISTPIWSGGVALPAAAGIGIPTTSSSGGGRNKTPGPYGNPLNKSQDNEDEQERTTGSRSFGVAPPPPPSGFGFVPSPSIGGSRPLGGGMTPSMGGTRTLSPSGGSTIPFIPSSPNVGGRESLFGRSPGPGRPGQLPSSTNEPTYNNPLRNREDEDENDDGFDHHTLQNTMRNANIGRAGSPAPPGGFVPPDSPVAADTGFGNGGGGNSWGQDASAWGTGGASGGASTGGAGGAGAGVPKKKKGGKRKESRT
ncbi:hypothetical protein CPB83DRAFT_151399 [Crepidotus variabilis]|uniref:Uncharacterized protein n=1 Tax=Crepidotus variabilis TaxID=179855 RepID=A0A9P6E3V0_9AGAR|nr:hypothetical protein CPB83DRAFT_151399 [Crepidotus variabilis]